jgi:hypothetical protein
MTDLFDLPFEEDAPEPEGDGQQSTGDQSARLKPRVPSVPVEREASAERFVDPSAVDPRLSTTRFALTVTELTVRVRDLLEGELFEVWVEGELSNCKIWNTGHLYFTLKDSATQLRGFMFRSSLRYLKFKPADGQRVVARGKITVYEPKGE